MVVEYVKVLFHVGRRVWVQFLRKGVFCNFCYGSSLVPIGTQNIKGVKVIGHPVLFFMQGTLSGVNGYAQKIAKISHSTQSPSKWHLIVIVTATKRD